MLFHTQNPRVAEGHLYMAGESYLGGGVNRWVDTYSKSFTVNSTSRGSAWWWWSSRLSHRSTGDDGDDRL